MTNLTWQLIFFAQLGEDEATEGGVVFLFDEGSGVFAEKLPVGAIEALVGKAGVLGILVLPVSKAFGVREFLFRLLGALSERSKGGALVGGKFLLVFMQGVITNNRLAITVGGVELAVTREAALQFAQ